MSSKTLLFCYGTLKQGFPRHWILQQAVFNGRAEYAGEYATCELYPLILRAPHIVPSLLHTPGVGRHVRGELYACDDTTITAVHASYANGVRELYSRRPVWLTALRTPEAAPVEAQTYFLVRDLPTRDYPHLDVYDARHIQASLLPL